VLALSLPASRHFYGLDGTCHADAVGSRATDEPNTVDRMKKIATTTPSESQSSCRITPTSEKPPQRANECSTADDAERQGDHPADPLRFEPEPHDVAAEDHHDQSGRDRIHG
jgi:hypothetical protein